MTGILALLVLANSMAPPALARLPWAATSGLHFVDAIVAADNYRAAVGGLAMKKSPSRDVREFGRMLWENSLENTRRLQWVLTSTESYFFLPARVSPRYMFVIDELVAVSGDTFDRRLIAQQTASLKEALALTEAYAQVGDDFDLKEFAARSVPRIKMQLDRVLELDMRHERTASHPS